MDVVGGRERVYFSSFEVLTVKSMGGTSSVELGSTSAPLEAIVAGSSAPKSMSDIGIRVTWYVSLSASGGMSA